MTVIHSAHNLHSPVVRLQLVEAEWPTTVGQAVPYLEVDFVEP